MDEHVRSHLTLTCTTKKIKIAENKSRSDPVAPEPILEYSGIDDKESLDELDDMLIDMGMSAIKALVSNVVSRALESALVSMILHKLKE